MKKWMLSSGLGLGLAACQPSAAPVTESVNLNLEVDNGVSFNGTSFAAAPMVEISRELYLPLGDSTRAFPVWSPNLGFNPYGGLSPNGPSFSGVDRDLDDIELDKGLRAEDVLGGEVEGKNGKDNKALLKVTGMAVGEGANADLVYYAVYVADGMGWSPLCGANEEGQPVPALAVPGTWKHKLGKDGGKWKHDKKKFSFACRGSSIAKCMEAGYKPWVDPESKNRDIQLRKEKDIKDENHLQACVRMLRADYCGDGRTHTVNGRRVEFWDTMGLHTRTQPEWSFEAGWGPDGAVLMRDVRVREAAGLPECFDKRRREDKGDVDRTESNKLYQLLKKEDIYILNSFETQL